MKYGELNGFNCLNELTNQISYINTPAMQTALSTAKTLGPPIADFANLGKHQTAMLEGSQFLQQFNQSSLGLSAIRNVIESQQTIVDSLTRGLSVQQIFMESTTIGLFNSVSNTIAQIGATLPHLNEAQFRWNELSTVMESALKGPLSQMSEIERALQSFSHEWINSYPHEYSNGHVSYEFGEEEIAPSEVVALEETQAAVISISNAGTQQDKLDVIYSAIIDLTDKVDRLEEENLRFRENNQTAQLVKNKKKSKLLACLYAFLMAMLSWFGQSLFGTCYEMLVEPHVKQIIVSVAKSTLQIIDTMERQFVASKYLFTQMAISDLHKVPKRNSHIVCKLRIGTIVEVQDKYKKWRKVIAYDSNWNPIASGWVQNWKLHKFKV